MPAGDYYPDFGGGPPGNKPPPGPPPPEEREAEETESAGESAVLPLAVFGDSKPQPGDRIEMEVVRLYEDEVEVRPVTSPEPTETTQPPADEEIDQMATAEAGV